MNREQRRTQYNTLKSSIRHMDRPGLIERMIHISKEMDLRLTETHIHAIADKDLREMISSYIRNVALPLM
jgi:hypothetical protein